ncbi:MAG: amidohydrolase family protein [Anaerolineae bacterium]|nr:amidohydrolase family protein [Anaerolineae bacterium]
MKTVLKHSSILLSFLVVAWLTACSPAGGDGSSAPDTPDADTPSGETAEPVPTLAALGPADVIFYNGTVITMESGQPQAQAVAITRDTILAVGTDEQITALAGENTPMIDLEGRTLMPGFIDSHSHWIGDRGMGQLPTPQEVIDVLLARGWTSINELFVNQNRLDELRALDESGELPVRVNAYLPVNFDDDKFGTWYQEYQAKTYLTPNLRLAGIKLFIDHDWGTDFHWTQEELNSYVLDAHESGWQVASHTVSQEALDMLMDALDQIYVADPSAEPRLRVEHAIQVRDDQIERMAALGAVASILAMGPADWPAEQGYLDLIGEQTELAARWRDFAESQVVTIASTDYPWTTPEEFRGDPPSPFTVAYQAATRHGYLGLETDAYHFDQTLSVAQTLEMLTIHGAYATFEEDRKGSLAPGKWADLVVLSANPFEVDVEALEDIEVLLTMIEGAVKYCREGQEVLCTPGLEETLVFGEGHHIVIPPGVSIKIPVMGPFSGEPAGMMTAIEHAVQMAVEDHGPIHGYQIEFVRSDAACDQAAGAPAAEEITTRWNAPAVIGPACSNQAIDSLPLFETAGLPSISASATRPDLTSLAPTTFNRVILHAGQPGAAEGAEIAGLESVQAFYAEFEARGGVLPGGTLNPFTAYAYDAARILLLALEQSSQLMEDGSLDIDRTALTAALRATMNYTGVTGSIRFEHDGDRGP